jgi:histone acetyltransferase (RNA polymerase elongator complex component)
LIEKKNTPFVIPIFLPHVGCTHQCIYCNQTAITGVKHKSLTPGKFRAQLTEFLEFKGKNRNSIQVAFYGGNFLGLEKDYIRLLLNESSKFVQDKQVDSIRFSTRPDTISKKQLDFIKDYPVSTVEIGAQSMDDRVLALSKRGHTALDTQKAVSLLRDRGYEIGVQMMVGLPGDNERKSIKSAEKIAALSPDFVRIYPTVVLENSRLAKLFRNGEYLPWSLERSVSIVKNLYLYLQNQKIQVVRMGLQVSENIINKGIILAGPYHPAFGHMVYSEIFLDMAITLFEADRRFSKTITLNVHPRSIPKMRGYKNKNVEYLKRKFQIQSLKIIPDPTLSEDKLEKCI